MEVNTSLAAIMPKILARGLMTLRTRCIMPRLVNSDYSAEAAQKGTTIDVPIPVAVGVGNVDATHLPKAPTGLTPVRVQIPLDQWVQNDPIGLSDKELCEIDANDHFLPMQMQEAVKALASNVNQFIFSKYKGDNRGVYGWLASNATLVDAFVDPFGTTGDVAGVSAATGAKKILNIQLCPRSDRRGVLNFDAEAKALDLPAFSDAEKIMSAVVKMEGEVGHKYGIDWVADDDVPNHTAGTNVDISPTSLKVHTTEAADPTAQTTDIKIKGVGSRTFLSGDIIQITGDSQTYAVCGNYSVPDTGIDVTICPGLKLEAAGDATIKVATDHAVNMVFHRDAFAFATRPLLANSSQYALGNQMISMQDPVTGLILRLEVSRQHKQTVWEFDILFGAALVRPDLAMRIAGAV